MTDLDNIRGVIAFIITVIVLSCYITSLMIMFADGPYGSKKLRVSKAHFFLSMIPLYGIIYLMVRKKENMRPQKNENPYLDALDIIWGISFNDLPLYINHKNPVVREFVKLKLQSINP